MDAYNLQEVFEFDPLDDLLNQNDDEDLEYDDLSFGALIDSSNDF